MAQANQGDEYIRLTGNVRVDDIQADNTLFPANRRCKNHLCWPRLVC
ncbi:flagellar basal body L-ring protein FlgH [Vibrio chagasii]|nr:flagellar basal body L-ring protein FlgH [Vibrio chagasii]